MSICRSCSEPDHSPLVRMISVSLNAPQVFVEESEKSTICGGPWDMCFCRCAGWSSSLLFAYDINRFSHEVAHILPMPSNTLTIAVLTDYVIHPPTFKCNNQQTISKHAFRRDIKMVKHALCACTKSERHLRPASWAIKHWYRLFRIKTGFWLGKYWMFLVTLLLNPLLSISK